MEKITNTSSCIIPNKDDLFSLTNLAKKIICEINGKNLFPVCYLKIPLWIFLQNLPASINLNSINPDSIKSVEIKNYKINETEIFFPTEITFSQTESKESTVYEKLVFGNFLEPLSAEQKKYSETLYLFPEHFPIRLKIFKSGTAMFSDTEFILTKEKWHKL